MASLTVLDVGHGNATVLSDNGKVVLIDTAERAKIQGFLKEAGIKDIDLLIISHSDQDHIGGLINILSNDEYNVKRLVINSDSIKESALWDDVIYLIDQKEREGKITVDGAVGPPKINGWEQVTEELYIEIVSPSRAMLLSGAGKAMPHEDKKLTSNSVSVVVRVLYRAVPVALITGDMDRIALDVIMENSTDISAKYLVFPHHGGLPGNADVNIFTADLLGLVKPSAIIFSNGRSRFNNPSPLIVRSSLNLIPDVRIMCTQLSKTCCAEVERLDFLPRVYSLGAELGASCAGSVQIDLETLEVHSDSQEVHADFVKSMPGSLCLKRM
ncbi:ComEC/Rec2 family competence protein [Pseudomonas corrugata]|uniref:ComEC/Rec2 family competence protein n=1 Tax=Pseudomonas corrugata TaxID=47879 RepID=UPI0028C49CC8|nr:MBL fold metallo-hydrolase [Pseudomonas corrugata]MDU9025316.1 MBL fold metallo-hydrolase [Pseudomonas corrugata]